MTFREEVFLLVIDKALIGFLGVLAGFWLTRRLEAYKSASAEQRDIAKERRHLLDRKLSEFFWPVYLRLEKDNAVWERMLGKYGEDESGRKLALEFEKSVLLPNHDEILHLIESHIHHVEDDEEVLAAIRAYIRHVAVYRALRAIGDARDPIALGEPWPEQLFPCNPRSHVGLTESIPLTVGELAAARVKAKN